MRIALGGVAAIIFGILAFAMSARRWCYSVVFPLKCSSDASASALVTCTVKARGVLIFPSAFRAAFIVGGQGGSGVLLTRDTGGGRWNGPAFYTLGGASVGFQAGATVSEVVALLMTERASRAC